MAYVNVLNPLASQTDVTTIRGVDTTERIFYISPTWMKELMIQNTGINNVHIRLSNKHNPITITPGNQINLSGEIAYFLASADGTQNIDILYKPTKKPIAKKVPPIGLYFDGIDDYGSIPYSKIFELATGGTLEITNLMPSLQTALWRKLIALGSYGKNGWDLSLNENGTKFSLFFASNSGWSGPATPFTNWKLNKFQTITITINHIKNRGSSFLNATYLDSLSPLPPYHYTTANLTIGKDASIPGQYTKSFIYSIHLYHRPLSLREISYNYINLFKPISKSLTLHMSPFSIDIVNSKWYDLSGNENHATLYGPTLKELWRPEQ